MNGSGSGGSKAESVFWKIIGPIGRAELEGGSGECRQQMGADLDRQAQLLAQ